MLLQDDSRFANHYMNIMASHNNPGEQETTVPTKQREYAQKMMKLTILSYAMRGGVTVYDRPGYHEDSAGLFLVNDNSQRAGIKIYTVDEIIRKAANDMSLVKWEGDPLKELSNDWVGDPNEMSYNLGWTRIAKMLSELHQMKIKMSISKRSLK